MGHQAPEPQKIAILSEASDRPYRVGMPLERAQAILQEGAGKQWDPEMIDAFFRAMPDILAIKSTYQPRVHPVRRPLQIT